MILHNISPKCTQLSSVSVDLKSHPIAPASSISISSWLVTWHVPFTPDDLILLHSHLKSVFDQTVSATDYWLDLNNNHSLQLISYLSTYAVDWEALLSKNPAWDLILSPNLDSTFFTPSFARRATSRLPSTGSRSTSILTTTLSLYLLIAHFSTMAPKASLYAGGYSSEAAERWLILHIPIASTFTIADQMNPQIGPRDLARQVWDLL